jgi:hypothetical protein
MAVNVTTAMACVDATFFSLDDRVDHCVCVSQLPNFFLHRIL